MDARDLGGATSEVYAQVSVDFREYLHLFKGARFPNVPDYAGRDAYNREEGLKS